MADPHVDRLESERLPEQDRPPMVPLLIGVIGTTIFVVGTTVALLLGFRVYGDWERGRKIGVDETLQAMVAASRAELDEYAVIDYEGDRFQVPVTRAMERIVRDPSLLAPQGPQVGQAGLATPAAGETAAPASGEADASAVEGADDETAAPEGAADAPARGTVP